MRHLPRPLVAMVLLLACSRPQATDQIATARVARGRLERIVVATGTIEPEKEVEVRPRISGIVETVHVEAGDMVAKDTPLVEIDRELLEAQVEEARGRLAGSDVEVRYAWTELQRATELRRNGTAAQHEYDEARARHERGQAAMVRDRATLNALGIQLAYATVTAPMAGKILDVDVEVGSAVSSVTAVTGGTRLLSIAAADTLHLKGLVDENEVATIAVGQPARIRTEAFGDRVFAGTVREIAPLGERQQNVTYFEVEVVVTDPDAARLKPRMSADGDIVTEVLEDVLSVPETALLYEGDQILVERPAGGDPPTFQRQPVHIGIVDGDRVQILDGVAEGDEVRLK